MTRITIDKDRLVVVLDGLGALWALKRRLEIPLAHVRGATVDRGIVRERKGVRAPGTHVPRVLTAGTFHQDGERTFWSVRNGDEVVVIQLQHEKYTRLVLEVDLPRETVVLIERALAART